MSAKPTDTPVKLRIVHEDRTPTFVNLVIKREPGPAFTTVVDLHGSILREAIADLDRIRRRYPSLKELEPIWAALRAVEAEQAGKPNGKL